MTSTEPIRLHPAHRGVLTVALVAAPVALALGDFLRLRVEGTVPELADDPLREATAQLAAIADAPGVWQAHGIVTLLAALGLVGAVIAILRTSAGQPVLALSAGVAGLTFAIMLAVHLGFYTMMLSVLAGTDPELAGATARIWSEGESSLVLVGVSVFMLSSALTPPLLGLLVWRSGVAPWWAVAVGFGGLFVHQFAGATDATAALLPLLLLVPFGYVVHRLSRRDSTAQTSPDTATVLMDGAAR